jgi:hypothetical protein
LPSRNSCSKPLVLNVTKKRRKDAPGFDSERWPNFAESAFADQGGG